MAGLHGDARQTLIYEVIQASETSFWGEVGAVAYELDSERFEYCLATALNFLNRYDEALPILWALPLAEADAQSWFQMAVAHEGLGDLDDAVS